VGLYAGYENKIMACNVMKKLKYYGPDGLCFLFMLTAKENKNKKNWQLQACCMKER
jgi:hypothetical protein